MPDQKTAHRPHTKPSPPAKETETSFFSDISFYQIIAGALAAVTAAFIASHIGVAGTLAGAAIGSVIGSVGSSVYRGSLQKSHEVVQKVASVAVPKTSSTFFTPDLNDTQEIAPIQSWSDSEAVQDIPLPEESTGTPGSTGTPPAKKNLTYNWRSILTSTLISLLMATVVVLMYERYVKEPQPEVDSTAGITRIVEQQVIMPEPTQEPTPTPTQTIVIVGPVPHATEEEPTEETPPAEVVEEPAAEEPAQEEPPVEQPPTEEPPVEEPPVETETPEPTPTPSPTTKPTQKPAPAPTPSPSPENGE